MRLVANLSFVKIEAHNCIASGLCGEGMEIDGDLDAVAEACIDNHGEIMRHGSPEMQTASQLLLYALAQEILRREQTVTAANDDQP